MKVILLKCQTSRKGYISAYDSSKRVPENRGEEVNLEVYLLIGGIIYSKIYQQHLLIKEIVYHFTAVTMCVCMCVCVSQRLSYTLRNYSLNNICFTVRNVFTFITSYILYDSHIYLFISLYMYVMAQNRFGLQLINTQYSAKTTRSLITNVSVFGSTVVCFWFVCNTKKEIETHK